MSIFLLLFNLPWIKPIDNSGNANFNSALITSAACASRLSDSSINAYPVGLISFKNDIFDFSYYLVSSVPTDYGGVNWFLPGGSSSITEKSRSAYALIASVLGIGVAVIISWLGN